jgi:hypothetical protein
VPDADRRRHADGVRPEALGARARSLRHLPERATGFISFHVLIENHTETRLVFQPQSCRLMTSWKDSSGPIDLPTIYTAYQIYDRPVPKNIDRVRAAILDGEIVLGRARSAMA